MVDLRALPRSLCERSPYRLDAKSQTQHYGSGGGGSTDIENQLRAVFIEADVDHSGYLSTKEFKQVCSPRTGPWKSLRPELALLQLLKHADLGLSNAQIRLLMSEADENEDDQIDYNEFMIAVVQASLRRRLPASAAARRAWKPPARGVGS